MSFCPFLPVLLCWVLAMLLAGSWVHFSRLAGVYWPRSPPTTWADGGSRWAALPSINESHSRAQSLMDRYGPLAIVLTRPVPILSESVALMAGLLHIRFGTYLLCCFLGLLPAAIIYPYAGHFLLQTATGVWSFALVIALAVLTWWGLGIYHKRQRRTSFNNTAKWKHALDSEEE
ncbi:MAG: VTT domain-containing protein [Cytophagales bacterium]|nr:VTT domain-containing protein [Cytophagales bacterium]